MVPGLKANHHNNKNRKNLSFQVDYLIDIHEIKPWPPSQSLRTLRSVLLQWQHGDRASRSTNQVVPSLGTGTAASAVADGSIQFNESFRLPVTLLRELSTAKAAGNGDTFQKNCIEFNLYEARKDKTLKGLLGTAVVDLAECGVVKDAVSISAPLNCKRTYGNASQPILHLKIQSLDKNRRSASSKETPLDRNGVDSVSTLMTEEYAEEPDTASFTDDEEEDDVSSHSLSLAVSSLAIESNGGGSPLPNKEAQDRCTPASEHEHQLAEADAQNVSTPNSSSTGTSSLSSSIDLTSDLAWITKKIGACSAYSSSSLPVMHEVTEKEKTNLSSGTACDDVPRDMGEHVTDDGSNDAVNSTQESTEVIITSLPDSIVKGVVPLDSRNSLDSSIIGGFDDNETVPDKEGMCKSDFVRNDEVECENYDKYQENGKQMETMDIRSRYTEYKPKDNSSQLDLREEDSLERDAIFASVDLLATQSNAQNIDKLNYKHVKSVRSPIESHRSNGLVRANPLILSDTRKTGEGFMNHERKDKKVHPKDTRNIVRDSKIKQLEQRIKSLETELREAAAVEVGLYSVVAEHGSSTNKVHAPARRLSRIYLYSSKSKSMSRGSAAKSAISGLVLVAKACGNDVPRLTFWLSNSIMLRAVISGFLGEQKVPHSGTFTGKNGIRNGSKKFSPLKWKHHDGKGIKIDLLENAVDWDDPCTVQTALEKVEGWIFSRIIESIWWQTFTPRMQSGAANAVPKGALLGTNKTYGITYSSFDEDQVTFSLELWKEAFRDACERICPIRAAGHECGCLPIVSLLIMEQCVARLDAAMFNAILRDSVDDMPTDPVSDPICDANVLPIPVGKASFGAGAQLKNAIGNWSRWLTDLFGIDDDDSLENEDSTSECSDDDCKGQDTSLKSFNLLNALSDLMMLPKDMLLSPTIRKEVCPTFGPPVIRRVLKAFVPDEFCPEPVPKVVLEALDSEDSSFDGEYDYVMNFPCCAAPIVYVPPSAASVTGLLGGAGNHSRLTTKGSLLLTKSYTSDDELDELASPLTCILTESAPGSSSTRTKWAPTENGSQNAMRYQLLREVWNNSDL